MSGFNPWRSAPPPTVKAQWEAWRSREVVWAKPRTNSKGQEEFVTKDGKTIPAEVLRRTHERLDAEKEGTQIA